MNKNPKNLNNYSQSTIAIIGHMGSGKSTIGRILSKKLNWNFYDSDKEIEKKEKLKINDIFEHKGEIYFRRIEKNILQKLLIKPYSVISLGGGSITNNEIRKTLQKTTVSIFLKVDINVLVERLKRNKNRPLLANTDIRKKINSLNIERIKFYEKANIIINNSDNKERTVEKIIQILFK